MPPGLGLPYSRSSFQLLKPIWQEPIVSGDGWERVNTAVRRYHGGNQDGHGPKASGRSRQKRFGRPPRRRGRALSRRQATARPSPQAVSAHSGYDRSAKNGNTRYARLQDANNQDWS